MTRMQRERRNNIGKKRKMLLEIGPKRTIMALPIKSTNNGLFSLLFCFTTSTYHLKLLRDGFSGCIVKDNIFLISFKPQTICSSYKKQNNGIRFLHKLMRMRSRSLCANFYHWKKHVVEEKLTQFEWHLFSYVSIVCKSNLYRH